VLEDVSKNTNISLKNLRRVIELRNIAKYRKEINCSGALELCKSDKEELESGKRDIRMHDGYPRFLKTKFKACTMRKFSQAIGNVFGRR
jgi:hypothetical protein